MGMLYRMGGFRPAPPLLAAGALLLLVVVAARGESAVPSEPAEWRSPPVPPPPSTSIAFNPETTDVSLEPPANASWVLDIVVGLVVMVLVVSFLLFLHAMVRERGRRRARDTVGEFAGADVTSLKDALEQARDVLARPGREPRDAVIRAWVTLENATEHGRAPHQTATEFTVSLLEKERADEKALRELRTLYHRARFGRRTGAADAAAARAALDRILATIR